MRTQRTVWARFAVTAIIAGILAGCAVEANDMSESPFPQRIRMAEFPEGLPWINTARPLHLKDLRGKFVLLDFWTYCCINCMHILPELKKVEKAFSRELVVIGVHSAKFDAEHDSRNIAEAIKRYEITHPVINDADRVLWERLGVTGWPTLMLIDPEGYLVGRTSGEVTFEELEKVIRAGIAFYRKQGLVNDTPLRLDLAEGKAEAATPLRFPGKVLADEARDRLLVADSNHNRIVIAHLDGKLVATVGSGAIGRADGDYAAAQFNHPQGMALVGEVLYVADTENHLLRKVDLQRQRVTTVAGTGRQGHQLPRFGPLGKPLQVALSSPWDLWAHQKNLFIAMAGWHQIWRMPLDESGIGPYAGNGREDIVDGPLLPHAPYGEGFASFAQPSGLASDGKLLYVADSEGSSIRAVALERGKVGTVVGTSPLPRARLFTFGDVDGDRTAARLQHPLGVVFYEGRLYVADTYNNKIKWVDPRDGSTHTVAGTGKPGKQDQPASFDEPAGISAAAGKLYVADTNNHRIRTVDLRADNKVSTLLIAGLGAPSAGGSPAVAAEAK